MKKLLRDSQIKITKLKNMIDYRLHGAGSKKYLWKKEEK